MSSFALDNTDEDGLVFGVGEGSTGWGVYAWRKNCADPVDNATIFSANGPGRWVRLGASSGSGIFNLATTNTTEWASATTSDIAGGEINP